MSAPTSTVAEALWPRRNAPVLYMMLANYITVLYIKMDRLRENGSELAIGLHYGHNPPLKLSLETSLSLMRERSFKGQF
jgi:hypothetical protein